MKSPSSEKNTRKGQKLEKDEKESTGLSKEQVDDHDDQSKTVSRLSIAVFVILLILISFGVYLLIVHWPDTTDKNPWADAFKRWFDEEIGGTDDHVIHEPHGHDDHSREDELHLEEKWSEAGFDDDEDKDELYGSYDHNNEHGSGDNLKNSESKVISIKNDGIVHVDTEDNAADDEDYSNLQDKDNINHAIKYVDSEDPEGNKMLDD